MATKKNENNVHSHNFIFDDTSDLTRSIAVSDMYYGDYSSIVALYKATGKPILLQNVELVNNETLMQEHLHSDAVYMGNRLLSIDELRVEYPRWYEYWLTVSNDFLTHKFVILTDYKYGISTCFNAVYKTSFKDAVGQYMFSFEDCDTKPWLYHPPCRIEKKLLFTPNRAHRWAFYDIDNATWSYEDVPNEIRPDKEGQCAIGGWQVYENSIIFAPGESGALARYELCTGKISYHSEWHSKLPVKANNANNINQKAISAMIMWRNSILLVSLYSNSVYELDPVTMLPIKIHKIGTKECGFKTAYHIPKTNIVYFIKLRIDGEKDWIETIVKWNIITGETKEIVDLPLSPIGDSSINLLNSFIFLRGNLYATPLLGDSILKINLETDDVIRFELKPKYDLLKRKTPFYKRWAEGQALPYFIFNGNEMTYTAQLPYDYSLVEVNFETGELYNRRKWQIEGIEELYKNNQSIGYFDNVIVENEFFSLENGLDRLASGREMPKKEEQKGEGQDNKNEIVNNDGTAGKAIYSYVKGLIGK